MAAAADFRTYAFDRKRVDAAAKSVGNDPYWRLYAAENMLRIIVNSVLTAQLGAGWWTAAVGQKVQGDVIRFQQRYSARPWHSTPGKHEIYYTFLSDLSDIMRANSNIFLPLIPDVDAWIARVEQVALPRNIVGHMNWLTVTDRKRIEVFQDDVAALAQQLESGDPPRRPPLAMRVP